MSRLFRFDGMNTISTLTQCGAIANVVRISDSPMASTKTFSSILDLKAREMAANIEGN